MPRATAILPCLLLALACADPSGSNGGGPPAVAHRSTAAVPLGSSGRPRVVTIQGNDSTGRPVSRGGPTVTVQIVGTNPGTAVVTDQGNGTWTATDTPLRPGFDTLLIAMDGVSFRIDNTLDSLTTVGDDVFTLQGDSSISDGWHNGTSYDGDRDAVVGDGVVTIVGNEAHWEIRRPLQGGSDDLTASIGARIGLCTIYLVGGGSSSGTTTPTDCNLSVNAQRRYVVVHLLAP